MMSEEELDEAIRELEGTVWLMAWECGSNDCALSGKDAEDYRKEVDECILRIKKALSS